MSVTIPNSVTRIGARAFYGCKNIKNVVFCGRTKDEVKSMESYPWGLECIFHSSDTPDGYRMLIEHG